MQIGTMLHAACVLVVCSMWAAPICAPAAAKAKINYKSLERISNQKGNGKWNTQRQLATLSAGVAEINIQK